MSDDPLLGYLQRERTNGAARLRELELAITQRERELRREALPPEGFPVAKGHRPDCPAVALDTVRRGGKRLKRWKPRITFTEGELRRMSEASEDE